jgi:ribosomal protein RSM22 (predicted rRNA methylase)
MNRSRVSLEPYQRIVEAFRARRRIKVKEIADAVRSLRRMSERRSPPKPRYFEDAHLRLGHACYGTPLGAAKLTAVLRELAAFDPAFVARPRVRILDVGCGAGAGLLGALEFWRGTRTRLDYVGFDQVDACFDDARLLHSLHPAADAADVRFVRTVDEGGFDLVVLIDSHGEIRSPPFVDKLLDQAMSPAGYLAIVEPADREPTLALMRLRDAVAARGGIRISAPCLPRTPCPMLRAAPESVCSMEIPIDRPRFVAEVDERLGSGPSALAFSYLVLTRAGRALEDLAPPDAARLVGKLRRAKGRHWGTFCARSGELRECRLLARDVNDANRAFVRAARGDVLDFAAGRISSVKTVDLPNGPP